MLALAGRTPPWLPVTLLVRLPVMLLDTLLGVLPLARHGPPYVIGVTGMRTRSARPPLWAKYGAFDAGLYLGAG